MKKIVATIIALSIVFTSAQANAATVSDTSDTNAKTVLSIAGKYKKGERMSPFDSFILRSILKPKPKPAGFSLYTTNFTLSKNISINNPGAYTFKLSGSASQTFGFLSTTDKFNITVSGSAPAGKTMIKPTSITINFYDFNFVVASIPPMISKSTEVSRSITCTNTSTCSLAGSAIYTDLSTLGYLAVDMTINYPKASYSFSADVR